MDATQRQVITNVMLASGAGLFLVGVYLLATGRMILGAALLLAGVGDLVAWNVLRQMSDR